MNFETFLCSLERDLSLPSGSLKGDAELARLRQWDSMAVLMVISTAESEFGRTVSGPEVRACATPEALFRLLNTPAA